MRARGMIVVAAVAGAVLGQAGTEVRAQVRTDDSSPTSATPPAATQPAQPPAPLVQAAPAPGKLGTNATVLDVSTIQSVIGRNVKSASGEAMGRIIDVLVMPSGQVRAAVLDFGGVLGVGSRKIAVDWKALSFADLDKDGAVQVLLTRNQIRVAPEYKAGDPVVVLEATPEAPTAGLASKPNVPMPASSQAGALPAGPPPQPNKQPAADK